MRAHAPRPQDEGSKLIKRILVLIAAAILLLLVGGSTTGYMYYRQYRHKAQFRDSIEPVNTLAQEHGGLQADVRRLLLAGDFDGLEALAAELRSTDATFSDGVAKLRYLYGAFHGVGPLSDEEWSRGIDQSRAWLAASPRSVTAHVLAAELWMAYASNARGDGWAQDVPPERWALFQERLAEAERLLSAQDLEPRCPGLGAARLRLAQRSGWAKEAEAKVFDQATTEYPGYQANYDLHLLYLQPIWSGAPGDWTRAAAALAGQPGGKERYARAIWFLHRSGIEINTEMSWPMLKEGFREMEKARPGSLRIKSMFCLLAGRFGDRAETIRLFDTIGSRMEAGIWQDDEQFTTIYHWATWEQGEQAGGDPLARVFGWFMRS